VHELLADRLPMKPMIYVVVKTQVLMISSLQFDWGLLHKVVSFVAKHERPGVAIFRHGGYR